MKLNPLPAKPSIPSALWHWIDRHFIELARALRLSYLPPLMVYLAAGISGLTAIVGTFFVKEYLGLSAEFLAALSFWAMLPWTLKLPIGHLVDLIWRFKGLLVFLGALLIAVSLLIMIGLLSHRAEMEQMLPAGSWYVLSVLLAPVGYVIQDVVADAMTVEAVPATDPEGRLLTDNQQRLMHATMQTLGRVATIFGTLAVALVNVVLFNGVEALKELEKVDLYLKLYQGALVIPVVSCLGVLLAALLREQYRRRLIRLGYTRHELQRLLHQPLEEARANWWILGGGLLFALSSIGVGFAQWAYGQELIFLISLIVILSLMARLAGEMRPEARETLIGTAVLIFFFRAVPTPGPGSSWWMIDVLGFDQSFMAKLSLIGSTLSLAGLFLLRRQMAEKPVSWIIGGLTLVSAVLSLPTIAMFYGFHHWTSSLTGGLIDARVIAIIDTALESPLGQIAMVPMLAWIAHAAPSHLKATFFAVMASFTNLSLALSQLLTKYLNHFFVVTREIRDPVSGLETVPANYGDLGGLLIVVTLLGLAIPFGAIGIVRSFRLKSV